MTFEEKMKEAEFNVLRNEMLKHANDVRNNSIAMYSSLFIIFAYMFSSKDADPIGFLVVIPFIYIFYIINRKSSLYMHNISSYFAVFGDEYCLKWENRVHIQKNNQDLYYKDKEIKPSLFNLKNCNFIIPIIVYIVAYVLKILSRINTYSLYWKYTYLILGFIGISASIYVIYKIHNDISIIDIRNKQDRGWEEIKRMENK